MSLTQDELRVAAVRAALYPADRGSVYLALKFDALFTLNQITTADGTAAILAEKPELAAFG